MPRFPWRPGQPLGRARHLTWKVSLRTMTCLVFCREKKRVWVWRRARLTELRGGPPLLSAAAPGDCASVTSSTGRLPNKQARGSGWEARWAVPPPHSGRRATRAAGEDRMPPTPPPSRLPETGLPASTTGLLGTRQNREPVQPPAQREHSCVHPR